MYNLKAIFIVSKEDETLIIVLPDGHCEQGVGQPRSSFVKGRKSSSGKQPFGGHGGMTGGEQSYRSPLEHLHTLVQSRLGK